MPHERALIHASGKMNLSQPTPNRRNRRDSSGRATGHALTPHENDLLADTFQIGLTVHGSRKTLRFMPERERPKLTRRVQVEWLPSASDYVGPRERELARIACMLEQGKTTGQIARRLGLSLRTVQRRVAYLLRPQSPARKSGVQAREAVHIDEGVYAEV